MKRTLSLLLGLPAVTLVTYACGGANSTGLAPDGSAGENSTGSGGKTSGSGGSGTGPGGSDSGTGGTSDQLVTCDSDKACTDQVCDVSRSICVDCLSASDCGENGECKDDKCVTHTPCASSKDCDGDQVCDKTLLYCVECAGPNDCNVGELCVQNACVASCSSDKDCSTNDQVCDTTGGYCVDCLSNADCADAEYCSSSHVCVPDVCEAGGTSCSSDTLMTCNADGTGYDPTSCPDGCVSDDGPAHCGDAQPTECAGATASFCTSIPKLTGTQVVDGEPDEFCNIPAQMLSPATAAYVMGPNSTATTPDGKTSSAQIKVAWSPGYLHLYVRVVDPTVVVGSGADYSGDNVQLFVSSSAPTTSGQVIIGSCPSALSDAQQAFLVPSNGVYAAHASFSCSAWAPTSGTYEYASKATVNGYAVELKYPFAGTASSPIGFDLQVGVNDSGTFAYEYGLFLGSQASTTCTTKSPWCDPMLWCTPTLAP